MPVLEVSTLFSSKTQRIEIADAGAEQFYFRLRKVAKERLKRARKSLISAVRIYDADLPDFALYVEFFEIWDQAKSCREALSSHHRVFDGEAISKRRAALQNTGASTPELACTPHLTALICEYAAPSHIPEQKALARFTDACAITRALFELSDDEVVTRARTRAKGGSQYALSNTTSQVCFTAESGMCIELDLKSYLDTGLFLDHRITRASVGTLSGGRRMLNLFAYTGVATLHALKSGATKTTTVDLSQTYLEWAQRNARHNGFDLPSPKKFYGYEDTKKPDQTPHELIRADVVQWLHETADYQRQTQAGIAYDVIFCDPPTFSNSKSMGERTWDVQRDHVEILRDAYELLADEGLVIFSCNLRGFELDEAALNACGYTCFDITRETIPFDFERNLKIHQCFVLCKNAHMRSMREVSDLLKLR